MRKTLKKEKEEATMHGLSIKTHERKFVFLIFPNLTKRIRNTLNLLPVSIASIILLIFLSFYKAKFFSLQSRF